MDCPAFRIVEWVHISRHEIPRPHIDKLAAFVLNIACFKGERSNALVEMIDVFPTLVI